MNKDFSEFKTPHPPPEGTRTLRDSGWVYSRFGGISGSVVRAPSRCAPLLLWACVLLGAACFVGDALARSWRALIMGTSAEIKKRAIPEPNRYYKFVNPDIARSTKLARVTTTLSLALDHAMLWLSTGFIMEIFTSEKRSFSNG